MKLYDVYPHEIAQPSPPASSLSCFSLVSARALLAAMRSSELPRLEMSSVLSVPRNQRGPWDQGELSRKRWENGGISAVFF